MLCRRNIVESTKQHDMAIQQPIQPLLPSRILNTITKIQIKHISAKIKHYSRSRVRTKGRRSASTGRSGAGVRLDSGLWHPHLRPSRRPWVGRRRAAGVEVVRGGERWGAGRGSDRPLLARHCAVSSSDLRNLSKHSSHRGFVTTSPISLAAPKATDCLLTRN